MSSARQLMNEILVERHAERNAVRLVRGINHRQLSKLNGLDDSFVTVDKNGENITFKAGRDISHKGAWEKYLSKLPNPPEMGWLTQNAGALASDYANWLRSGGHTARYRYIKSSKGRKWVRDHARLTVIIRILEYKLKTHNFVDSVAERDMGNTQMLKDFSTETHEAINHAAKNHEDPELGMEKVYLKYLSLIEGRNAIGFEELPALPPGTPDPLALPDGDEEDEEVEDE